MLRRAFMTGCLAGLLATPCLAGEEAMDACGRDRATLEILLAEGISAQQLSEEHEKCSAGIFSDGFESGDVSGWMPTKQETTATGSIFYEEIDACGYHPQRRELDCAVEVKQSGGYGGTPTGGPGSNEWILYCVDYQDGNGLVPVNVGFVHVHDDPFMAGPSWYYGISVAADTMLYTTPLDGRTLVARAILSWTLIPNGCNFQPPWGNQADFRIKLDP